MAQIRLAGKRKRESTASYCFMQKYVKKSKTDIEIKSDPSE
jgi:hypothetical protein